jgi:putative membrane protein
LLASMLTHHPASIEASHIVSFLFCAISGIGYGLLVEFLPIASIGRGSVFGFFVWVGAHQIIMPWMGLTPSPWNLPANEQLSECLGHVLWGLAIGVFFESFYVVSRRVFAWRLQHVDR